MFENKTKTTLENSFKQQDSSDKDIDFQGGMTQKGI